MYAIKKGSLYVSKPGSVKSYTKDIRQAQTYPTEPEAMHNKCGNKYVVNVYDEIK